MSPTRILHGTVGLLLLMAACESVEPPTLTPPGTPAMAQGDGLPGLRPLDDAHAGDFRRVFDDGKARARYVVALSPT